MLAKRACIVGVFVLLSSCKSEIPESEIAARVDGSVILKSNFNKAVERTMARYKGAAAHKLPPGIEVRIQESVLKRLVNDRVIEIQAEKQGLLVSEADLEAKFKEHKSRFRTDQAFNDYLKRSGNTEEHLRADLKRNLLRDRVVEHLSGSVEIKDEEVQQYYETNKQRFVEREQIRVSRILLRTPPHADGAAKQAVEKQATQVRAKAAGGADFAALAKEFSQAPEAASGGNLGWVARGRMPAEFEKASFALGLGEVSNVVKTAQGFEIIKVSEKKPERQRPLAEVTDSIRNSLLARKRNEKRREVLRKLKSDAKVEMLLAFEHPKSASPPAAARQPKGLPGKLGSKPTEVGVPLRPAAPAAAGAPAGMDSNRADLKAATK